MHGLAQNALNRAVATLLCIPAQYPRVLTQLGLGITRESQLRYYDTSRLGDENHTGTSEVARYLVSIGTTAEQAEHGRLHALTWNLKHTPT